MWIKLKGELMIVEDSQNETPKIIKGDGKNWVRIDVEKDEKLEETLYIDGKPIVENPIP